MSRSIAAALLGVVRTATAPLSHRQRDRVNARLIEGLERGGIAALETPHGVQRMLRLRSAHCATQIERFFTDEPETLAWIDAFAADDVLLDVGANIGSYTLYAALAPTRRVVAVEPNGINFGVLVEHLAMNGVGERVVPLCVALGARTGLERLHMSQAEAGAGGASLGETYHEVRDTTPAFSQAMLTYTVDDLFERFDLPAPTHMKLDVDGTEHEILAGAAQTLRRLDSVLVEDEARGGRDFDSAIRAPLADAGLVEDTQAGGAPHRNRVFRRASGA